MLSLIFLLVWGQVSAVCIGSPVDVVKSRMTGDSSAYKNTIDCFIKTLKNDGPLAFYMGFIPNFGRLGSWNVIMFLTLEPVQDSTPSLFIFFSLLSVWSVCWFSIFTSLAVRTAV